MTEKNYKKVKHFLQNQTSFSNTDELTAYLKKMSFKEEISEKEWSEFFEIILGKCSASLVKAFLSVQPDIGSDMSKYVPAVVNWYTRSYADQKAMTEIILLLMENAMEKQRGNILGKAFVTACLYNHIFVVKFLLGQGVDYAYCYKKMTGEDAALKYAKGRVGQGDDTLYQYLQRNKIVTENYEDIEKYFMQGTFGRNYEPPKQEEDLNSLTSKEQAIFIAEEYGYDNLLEDSTTGETLHSFLQEEYNWDDGLELPYYIALHKNCQLATALKLFWSAEGIFFFKDEYKSRNVLYKQYLQTLYERIVNGTYKKGDLHYTVPVDNEDKEKIRQQGVDEIIISDV